MIKRVSNPLLKCEKLDFSRTIPEFMEKEQLDEIDFQKYWFVLKRRWLPASVVFISVVGLAALYALTRKPSYAAEAQLLFQTSQAPSLTGILREGYDNSEAESLGQLETLGRENNPLDTQAAIVRSLPIAQETIKALNLKDDEGSPLDPETLVKELTVKGVAGTDILRIAYQADDPKQAAAIVNKVMDVFIQSNIQSNRAEPIAAREFIAAQLPNMEAAVQDADQALREFKEKNDVLVLEEEASAAVTSITTLNAQIAQTQAQLADVTAQARQLQSQIRADSQQALIYAKLSQSPGVQDVLNQLQQAQRELTVQQTRFLEAPPVTRLEEKVAALEALLQERVRQVVGSEQQIPLGNLQLGSTGEALVVRLAEVESQRVGLVDRLNVLSSAYGDYKQRARNIPALEKTQRELERRLEAAQKTYAALLARLQAVQVTENQNIGNTRIVSRARVPEEPIDSKGKLIVAAGALAGLLLGIATAFLLDLLDQSVKTVQEGREQFGYTLLGVIPSFGQAGRLGKLATDSERSLPRIVSRDMPHLMVQEAYQMLQANLKFLSSDREIKAIVVTSSMTGEGKSEVAANLAAAIAQVGRRVLLIDADMRHPTQHVAWNLSSGIGLSHVLVGQNEVHEAIQEVMPNLYLLPSGVTPPNPIALLDSNRMATLLGDFSGRYDFVIFDTPPITACADASVLGRMADGIILIVRPGVLNNAAGSAAKDILTSTGQNVLGIVVNGVNVHNEPDSYFHYTQNYATNRSSATRVTLVSNRHSDS